MERTLNILLVEDSGDDVFFFRDAFEKAGGSGALHAVSDGIEALAYLNGEGLYGDRTTYPFPDVLLLDLNMPRMNGFEVLQWVRQSPRCNGLVVHVLTSSVREADVARAYALRANGYVVKPTRISELAAFVSALLGWHRFLSFPEETDDLTLPSGRLSPVRG